MLQEAAIKYYHVILNCLERFTSTKFWIIKSTLILSLLVILTSFPDYHWYIQNHDGFVFKAIDWQINHPFQQLPEKYTTLPEGALTGPSSQLDKRWSRITIPLIGYLLDLDTFSLIIIQHVLGIFFLCLLLGIAYSFTKDKIVSFLIGLVFASTFSAKWIFQDFSFYDGVAYFFLLLAMWRKSYYIIFFSILLASFTDERALIASSLVYLWWHLKVIGIEKLGFKNLFKFYTPNTVIISAWLVYFLIRYILLIQYFGLRAGTTGLGLEPFRYNFKYIPMGFFTFLEFAWFFVLLAYFILLKKRKYSFAILLFLTSGISYLVAFMVFDVSRSIGYAFPVLLISLYIIWQMEGQKLRVYLLIIGILCFLLPTHAVFVDGVQWLSPIFPKILKLF